LPGFLPQGRGSPEEMGAQGRRSPGESGHRGAVPRGNGPRLCFGT
jgi:hypothetical protein